VSGGHLGGRLTTSTGVVLVASIAVASLLLLAVVVLLVFYRHDDADAAGVSADSFPAGCRRYLAACGLGRSAVTPPPTQTTSPTAVDDRRPAHPSRSRRLSAGTVVVSSAQMKYGRAQNNQGVIEWYV